MKAGQTINFSAKIEIIGINPFVHLPAKVLEFIITQAGKDKGKIPVGIKIEGYEFVQTLVKYSGHWRLYLNTAMRKAGKKVAGESALFEITFDPAKRTIKPHPGLTKALS
jgi:hypothetical protein